MKKSIVFTAVVIAGLCFSAGAAYASTPCKHETTTTTENPKVVTTTTVHKPCKHTTSTSITTNSTVPTTVAKTAVTEHFTTIAPPVTVAGMEAKPETVGTDAIGQSAEIAQPVTFTATQTPEQPAPTALARTGIDTTTWTLIGAGLIVFGLLVWFPHRKRAAN